MKSKTGLIGKKYLKRKKLRGCAKRLFYLFYQDTLTALRHYDIMALWHYSITALWHYGITALWIHYGIMASLRHGIITA